MRRSNSAALRALGRSRRRDGVVHATIRLPPNVRDPSPSTEPDVIDIADPRLFPQRADATHEPLLELAQASLAAPSSIRSDEIDRALVAALVERLRSGRGQQLANLIASASSVAIARHLWRRLIEAWREASVPADGERIAGTVFALPGSRPMLQRWRLRE